MSDAEAASLLGITRQEVLAYRVAHGVKRHRRAPAPPSTDADTPRGPTKLLRRRGLDGPIEEVLVDAPPPVTADPATVDDPAPRGAGRRMSAAALLEGVRLKLGRVPDQVIAEEVGISRDAVGIHRRKLGIPAYDGYQFVKSAQEVPSLPAAPAAAAPASKAPPKPGRNSVAARLDAARHRLGQVPDDVIATEVGLSRSVVGAYRRKHGIPAYEGYLFTNRQRPQGRSESTPPAPTPAPVLARTPGGTERSSKRRAGGKAATVEPAPTAPVPMTILVACRVVASAGGRRLEVVALGAGVAEASGRAEEWLGARDDGPWRIDEVIHLGVAVT